MGHPINPISFRLGVTRSWGLTSSSLENVHHYFFFNSNFWNSLNFFRRLFNNKVMQKLGFIFSHLYVSESFRKHHYLIFFYDGVFEGNGKLFYRFVSRQSRYRRMIFDSLVLLKKHFFKTVGNFKGLNFRFFLDSFYDALLFRKFIFITFINRYFSRSSNVSLNLFLIFFNVDSKLQHLIFFFLYFLKIGKKPVLLFRKLNFLFQIEGFFNAVNLEMFNLILHKAKHYYFFNSIKNKLSFFRFNKILIKFFKELKNKKFLFLKFFVKFLRSFLFTSFFRVFITKFKLLLFPKNFNDIVVDFKSLPKKAITASVVSRYVCIRLGQRYPMRETIRPVIKDLSSNQAVAGFKISCCGRFTKKEIATFFWKKINKVSLNKTTAFVDYSFNEVVLKYSMCGVKVWLQVDRSFPIKQYLWDQHARALQPSLSKKRFYNVGLKPKLNSKSLT